ncbi:choice-of-anchor C family protein [Nonomuraea aurantiaca]|uniref:choice-of-anchor C family protein n=1 Tax=Nonomuraea aurantiaca TaxID=2878562 RepID=UPI001CDA274A|nr:choice-of-anchor C family protein [Nonomuraea aurantiaca]MCA2230474.1 choice-of-anchor C family protein [Nonomuraea aurantiaca]
MGALTAAFAPTSAAATSGLGNGSFEQLDIAPDYFQNFVAGESIGTWRVSMGSVDLIRANFWQASDGRQSLDLNGSGDRPVGGVQQTFATRPGETYEVVYSLAGNPGGDATAKTGAVLVNGAVVQSFSFGSSTSTREDMRYQTRKVRFIAIGLSTTLEFRSTTEGAYGPVIDDVDVGRCACGATS